MVLLFLPEICGLLTHLQQPRAGELTGYDVSIPLTWVILGHGANQTTGWSSVSGIAGRGMGVDPKHYLHFGDPPLSSWSVGTFDEGYEPSPSNRNESAVRRDFQVGKTKLSCFEHDLPERRRMRTDPVPLANIECSGSNRLRPDFLGEKSDVPTFYHMIASITPALPR
jgi:hypothetical protein